MTSPSLTMPQRAYPSTGRCIYCGEYPSAQTVLTEEHIIPESLQGTWKLSGACKQCAEKSNEEYENPVLQSDMVRTMRASLALRRKRWKKKPPIRMPPLFVYGTSLKATLQEEDYLPDDGDVTYPPIFFMLLLEPALKLVGLDPQIPLDQRPIRLWLRAIENPLNPGPVVISDPAILRDAYTSKTDLLFSANVNLGRAVSIRQRFPLRKFMRMLSKIAYCFAVAEHGFEKYKDSVLRKIVLGEREDLYNFVGGAINGEHLTDRYLHYLAFRKRGDFETVRVHLFSSYRAPAYEVAINDVTQDW